MSITSEDVAGLPSYGVQLLEPLAVCPFAFGAVTA
jgi:hypothetical protein